MSLGRLTIEGLMTIPPFAPEAETPAISSPCANCVMHLEADRDVRRPGSSMGMSADFAIAIEEGATLVRVGTAIFGERSRPKREWIAAPEAYSHASPGLPDLREVARLSGDMRFEPATIEQIGSELAIQWNDGSEPFSRCAFCALPARAQPAVESRM